MPRNLRRSTLVQREEFELKRKSFKVKKLALRKKSHELQQIIEQNKESLSRDIETLCSVVDTDKTDSEESTEKSDDSVFVSEEEALDWDSQVDISSPLKDTSDLLDTTLNFEDSESVPPALTRARSVSVSVNRAKYIGLESGEILDLEPVCRNLNQSFSSENNLRLLSQESFLERNLKAKEVEALNIIDETDEHFIFDENTIEANKEDNKMDEGTYKGHVKQFKSKIRKIESQIKRYTKEEVTLADSNEYKDNLSIASTTLAELTDGVNDVIVTLEENTEQERIEELESLLTEIRDKVNKNEKEVKVRMLELSSDAAANQPRSEAEKKSDDIKVKKLKKRMTFLVNRAKENEEMIQKIDGAENMTDNEVREKYIESKVWKETAYELRKSKEDIEQEVVGLDISEEELQQMKDDVQRCVDVLTTKIEILKLEDKERGLFTAVNKNLSREKFLQAVFPKGPIFSDFGPLSDFLEQIGPRKV